MPRPPASRPPASRPPASSPVLPRVLLDDGAIVAVDKPSGWLVHAEADRTSVLGWLRERETSRGGNPDAILPVHRLDRDTSGVLLFARTAEVAAAMGDRFREHALTKVYLAAVSPLPPARWQETHLLLRPLKMGQGEFMEVVRDGGQPADAEVEVLARGRRLGLVRVIPLQGRKHQVRATLASLGAPIAGDFLYGGALSKRLADRVLLHARSLAFAHPNTGAHVLVKAPLPADFKAALLADACSVPGDVDRRHRTEPEQRRKGATATLPNVAALARNAVQPQRTIPTQRVRPAK